MASIFNHNTSGVHGIRVGRNRGGR